MQSQKATLVGYSTKIITSREFFSFAALVALTIVAAFLSPRFLTFANWRNLLSQVAIIAVLAVGQTYVILTGGIDLSVGAVLALSGAFTAYMMKTGGCILFSHPPGIAGGDSMWTINRIFVTKMKIPSFVTTLAMIAAARGGR